MYYAIYYKPNNMRVHHYSDVAGYIISSYE